jgi:hypothetical protein
MKALLFQLSLVGTILATAFGGYHQQSNEAENARKFKEFVKLFPQKEMPYSIGAADMNAWIEQRNKKAAIKEVEGIDSDFNTFIPEMAEGEFSRIGPDTFRPRALLASNDKSIIVVYSRSRGYYRNSGSYYLASYTPNGKRVENILIARSNGYEGFTGCNINKATDGGMQIVLKEYKNNWKNQSEKYAENNYIVSSEPLSSNVKQVLANGDVRDVYRP